MMTTASTRRPGVDIALSLALFMIAVSCYAALFLYVPPLTEVRDFLMRFGQNARLWHIFTPAGDGYRPFSWNLFYWQQQIFGFRTEAVNLGQFVLLGLCALTGYVHLRQLLGNRAAAFGAIALWISSLP